MPTKDFNVGGWRTTGDVRARPTMLFGLIVIEELWESNSGDRQWRRIRWPQVQRLVSRTNMTEGT